MLNCRNTFPMGDDLSLGILITDLDGKCLYFNAAYQELCGWSGNKLIGSHWSSAIYLPDREKVRQHWDASMQGHGHFLFETRIERPNGELVKTRHEAIALQVTDGILGEGYIHTLEHTHTYQISERARRKAEEQRFANNERDQVIALDSLGDAVLSTDHAGRVSYMNALAEKLTGFSCDEAIGRRLSEVFRLVSAKSHKRIVDPAQRATLSNSVITLEANALLVTKDGVKLAIEDSAAPVRNNHGMVTGAVIVFQEARFSRMAYLPSRDALTGLHNRNAFYEHFERSVAFGLPHEKKIGVMFINIDNFKDINSAYGFHSGDIILATLASRLRTCASATDTVCRYGGDEFVVLLSNIERPTLAFEMAGKIHNAAAAPIIIAEHTIEVQLSIGVSVYPDDGETAETLLKKAVEAMYRQKVGSQLPLAATALSS